MYAPTMELDTKIKKMRINASHPLKLHVFELDDPNQNLFNYYIANNTENIIHHSATWAANLKVTNRHSENPTKEFQIHPRNGYFKYNWKGHEITIKIHEEGNPKTNYGDLLYFRRMLVEYGDFEILKAFLKEALNFRPPLQDRLIRIYYSDAKNNAWVPKSSSYAQTIDHIFIDPKLKTTLVSHIDNFLSNKERYVRFGRPYKLNILLHGVPGSGKSSLIKSIAMKYSRPVYILSFSKTMIDDTLISLVNDLPEDAILMFEDIDSFFIKRDPGERLNVSFSCLLNVLDGALTRQGVISFLTANDINQLDAALIRPGRIDRIVRFDYPRREQIRAAYDALEDNPTEEDFAAFYDRIREYKINMSGIVDYLFRGDRNIEDLIAQTKELTRESNADKLFM